MLKRLLTPFVILFLVAGCASSGYNSPAPETPRQRLHAAQLDYAAIVTTVIEYADSGIIVKGSQSAKEIDKAMLAARDALRIWEQLPDGLDTEQGDKTLLMLQAIRSALNSLLIASQKKE